MPGVVHLRGVTMGTTYNVKYVGSAGSEPDIAAAVERVLEHFDEVFSLWRSDSEISRFNTHRSTEPFPVDPLFVGVLRPALALARNSDGAFDPTVRPLLALYGFGPDGERKVPDADELAAAQTRVGYRKIEITPSGALGKSIPDLELDLNAIAKGAGVDQVVAELARLGYPDHMVEIGGEVRCSGTKPGVVPWQIGVEKPALDGADQVLYETVPLADRAMATSGSYRIYFESGGTRRHHILDARTGVNAPGAAVSVSVQAPDCALADGLATTLMIIGPELAPDLFGHYPGVDLGALFLLRAGDGGIEERAVGWR